ncbi:PREDICTED: RAB6A-GEF complex partner protein 1-like, partial [Priapulus caudatus]|uniref:Protein RIC1 homolog n=1 Tax=Priapulus caudatus TaxID=37621 RepID=A0ABM1EYX4_PRICU
MYFPVSWPRYLNIPLDEDYKVLYITSNRERVVYCVVTGHEISIWYCKPCVQIVSHRRSDNSVSLLGSNKCAVWKPDSTCIAVVTDKGYVVFYKLEVDKSVGNSSLYQQLDSRSPSFRRDSAELFLSEKVPAFTLNPEFSVQTEGLVTSLVPIRDELVLCLDTGSVQRLKWDGTLNSDMCYGLGRVPFSIDQEHSRAEVLEGSGAHITHMEYSPLMAGFAVVLSDHRAAFLTAPTLKFEPTAPISGDQGQISAQGVVFVIDEVTGGLNVSHRLVLSSKDYPDVQAIAGPVVCMQWSPDGCAVALAWRNGGLSLWSVFGSLLFCTLGGDYEMSQHLLDTSPLRVRSMEWGMEGYHLWMACEPPDGSSKGDLLQMNFLKSALTVNPCKSNHDHLFLQGEDRLLINTGDTIMRSSVYTTRTRHLTPPPGRSDSLLVGNKHWHVIQIPMTYLGNNWPIRYAAVDSSGNYAAVAGRSGFAHYALYSRKWKLFGNVTQEKDVVVTGGLTWWKDYIIMGCYNLNDYRDEIRVYPRASNLDNAHACIVRAMTQVLLLNIYRDTLISFCADSHIVLYSLAEVHKKSVVEVEVVQLQDVCISNIIPHPACVVSVSLTAVRKEIGTRYTQNSKDGESIILNVSGKLLMIQREHSKQDANDVKHRKQTTIQYDPPVMLASGVENIWISLWTSNEKRHLTEALWIGCGAQGMKVWLPLFPREGERPHNFMSKRIMLPFQLRIYPLAVLFEDAVVLCVCMRECMYVRVCVCMRECMYVHPLLPRVVAFIEEFPEFLQTVVHCARKTEIALWHYLFTTVGNPTDLFQECLKTGKLETAASYLIILQNLEPIAISRQHATMLLDATLEAGQWELSKDITRFLRAIGFVDSRTSDFYIICRNRAAKIEDFVTTLKRLHEDFQWPYPIASPSLLQTFQRMSNSRKNESMVTMYSESDLSALLTEEDDDDDVLLASSNSFSFSAPHYLHTRGRDDAEMSPLDDASKTLEAFLEPQPMHFDGAAVLSDSHSHGTTEDSSLAGEAEDVTVADDIQDACALEQWTQELATRGPPNMEVELRYLLQMVVEAGCFEWALLLTVLLRDALAVSRVARAATAPDVPTDVIARSRDGLAFLELWAKTVCLGYRPFVALIRQQAMMLERCVASRPRPRRTPSPPLLETTNPEDAAPLSTSAVSAAAGATYEHALLDDDDDDV